MALDDQYRHLTLRHERQLLANHTPSSSTHESEVKSDHISPLAPGSYDLKVSQEVPLSKDEWHSRDKGWKGAPARRQFEALGTQWSLDNGEVTENTGNNDHYAAILSVSPAPGHTAMFRTLPHIVFRNPHLPWARQASKQNLVNEGKNATPWLALIPFTTDELQLDQEEVRAFFPPEMQAKLNENLGWDLAAGQINNIQDKDRLSNTIATPDEHDEEVKTTVLPIPGSLFRRLFTNAEEDNPTKCDVSHFQFLSHVRTMATDGLTPAGASEPGICSVVISHRLGSSNANLPTLVKVHLVSLLGIDGLELSNVKDRALVTSLHSWTYTALPLGSSDFRSALQGLDRNEEGFPVLRTRPSDISAGKMSRISTEEPSVEHLAVSRINDGYTFARHRDVMGEQTTAMFRGPLALTRVAHPSRPDLFMQSNFGSDLQILDPGIGVIDISYYSAWQLGKTLALGDPIFTAALARLRALISREALEKARDNTSEPLGKSDTAYSSHDGVVSETIQAGAGFDDFDAALCSGGATVAMMNRWNRRQHVPDVNTGLPSEEAFGQMYTNARYVLKGVAAAVDGGPYNYHTVSSNKDYALVQEWILDKLHLARIPAHYLLPDHSRVPQETIRLFHIDGNWTEALIDGALSLANHSTDDPAEDYCRSALKAQLNEYLATPIKGLDHCQQIPTYGFLLRSQVLDQFPNIVVSAVFEEQLHTQERRTDARSTAPILVQRRLAPDLMLLLLDRETPDLIKLQFTLPAHQRTFAIAAALHLEDENKGRIQDEIEIEHQKTFASKDLSIGSMKKGTSLGGSSQIWPMKDLFDCESRTMKVGPYARKINDFFRPEAGAEQHTEDMPTSAVLALQLEESAYTLDLDVKSALYQERTEASEVGSDDPHAPKGTRVPSFRFRPPPYPAVKRASTQPFPNSFETSHRVSSYQDSQESFDGISASTPADLLLQPDDFLPIST